MDDREGRLARAWEFERFVGAAAQTRYPNISDDADSRAANDAGVDFLTRDGDVTVLIEAKSETPQTASRLDALRRQLESAAMRYEAKADYRGPTHLVLAVPGVFAPRKASVLDGSAIEVWDGPTLRRLARTAGIAVPDFVARTLEEESFAERQPAEDLDARLAAVRPGRADWPLYEAFCEDALNYLLAPPLAQAMAQHRDGSRFNRRDFIMPNYSTVGFWEYMRMHYHADYVVVEVKNLASRVGKKEILQIANYLSRHGTGLFGLVLNRSGFGPDAKWTCREQWVLHDKLIVGLDDEDVRQMLSTRRSGGDPADLIRQRIEDFRLGI